MFHCTALLGWHAYGKTQMHNTKPNTNQIIETSKETEHTVGLAHAHFIGMHTLETQRVGMLNQSFSMSVDLYMAGTALCTILKWYTLVTRVGG